MSAGAAKKDEFAVIASKSLFATKLDLPYSKGSLFAANRSDPRNNKVWYGSKSLALQHS